MFSFGCKVSQKNVSQASVKEAVDGTSVKMDYKHWILDSSKSNQGYCNDELYFRAYDHTAADIAGIASGLIVENLDFLKGKYLYFYDTAVPDGLAASFPLIDEGTKTFKFKLDDQEAIFKPTAKVTVNTVSEGKFKYQSTITIKTPKDNRTTVAIWEIRDAEATLQLKGALTGDSLCHFTYAEPEDRSCQGGLHIGEEGCVADPHCVWSIERHMCIPKTE